MTLSELVALVVESREQAKIKQAELDQEKLNRQFRRALSSIGSFVKSHHRYGDPEGAVASICGAWNHVSSNEQWNWACQHQELIWLTASWVDETDVADSSPPQSSDEIANGWRVIRDGFWRDQARLLLDNGKAISRGEPKLRAVVQSLMQRKLLSGRTLEMFPPVDGDSIARQSRDEYDMNAPTQLQTRSVDCHGIAASLPMKASSLPITTDSISLSARHTRSNATLSSSHRRGPSNRRSSPSVITAAVSWFRFMNTAPIHYLLIS